MKIDLSEINRHEFKALGIAVPSSLKDVRGHVTDNVQYKHIIVYCRIEFTETELFCDEKVERDMSLSEVIERLRNLINLAVKKK